MTPRVLVAYATKKGSTREVAEAIAAQLEADGVRTVLQPARDKVDLRTFDGVVLGGALYTGRWHRDARRFLHRHRRILTTLPVAVYGMGPSTMDEHAMGASLAQLERALARTPEVLPVAVAIFGGVIDPEKLHFPLNHMHQVDLRDWNEIRAWAAELPTELELDPVVHHRELVPF
jgi:menaquinone-dependent protoporphyrinogen oxidase